MVIKSRNKNGQSIRSILNDTLIPKTTSENVSISSISRPYRFIAVLILICVVGAGIFWAGHQKTNPIESRQKAQLLQGRTMGTTYTIRFLPELGSQSNEEMQRLIDEELNRVNQQMSTYLKDSEITRFNDSQSMDWFPVSLETAQVVALSLEISEVSNGAFDVTVGPLVDLWGFGPVKRKNEIPTDEEVETTKASVGFKKLEVRFDPPALKKLDTGLRVDLSAIAKGYGVDRVGEVLRSDGIANYFVEIGGEIIANGKRADGQLWQVGIEAPLDFKRSIQTIIGLSGAALATSGDYRNFFESEGKRFSHTIDPNTGRPVTHQLASVSVVADNCALADGIATCMMVMGTEQGLKLAESKKWAVLLMERKSDQIRSICSTRFSELFPQVCKQLTVAN